MGDHKAGRNIVVRGVALAELRVESGRSEVEASRAASRVAPASNSKRAGRSKLVWSLGRNGS